MDLSKVGFFTPGSADGTVLLTQTATNMIENLTLTHVSGEVEV